MRKLITTLPILGFLCLSAVPTYAHDGVLSQLVATCTQSGDYASAALVNNPFTHHLSLALNGEGVNTDAQGNVYFQNAIFHNVVVDYFGDCFADFEPASLQVRISFLPPHTTTVLNHGYNCLTNTVQEFPNGEKRMVITTQSLCDCHMMIPPGSRLFAVMLELTVIDPEGQKHTVIVDRLAVNDHVILFDPHARSASCGVP